MEGSVTASRGTSHDGWFSLSVEPFLRLQSADTKIGRVEVNDGIQVVKVSRVEP